MVLANLDLTTACLSYTHSVEREIQISGRTGVVFYAQTCVTLQERSLGPAANLAEVNGVLSFCKEGPL